MTDYGMFTIDAPARTARGILLPFGVRSKGVSSSGTPRVTFAADDVALPSDPMVVSLNDEHARFGVIGRATTLERRDVGVYAEFAIAATPDADAWLADHGDKAYLSAEIADLVVVDGRGAGRVAGAAVTGAPAFAGTALFSLAGAVDDDQLEDDDDDVDVPLEDTRNQLDLDQLEDDDTDVDAAPAPQPAEPPAETESEDDMTDAVMPKGSFNRRPAPVLTKAGFFAALNNYRRTADLDPLRPYMAAMTGENDAGMFALSDVKYDGTGGLAADAALPNQWLGELWDGVPTRKVIPLLTAGTLAGIAINAWTWLVKPTMATWSGNKAAVPSNAPTVAPKQFFAQRYAGGHDLAREYYDFNQTEFIDSYVEAMVQSYGTLSDSKAVTELVAGATAFTPGTESTVGKGLSAIVDGALAVIGANAVPSFAIVSPAIYREVLLTSQTNSSAYLNVTASLGGGSAEGFQIVPWAGAELAAGQLIVGAREAATAWELPGVPIRVSAPDLVKGGIDEAFFGYTAVGVTYPKAVVKATITLPLAEDAESEPAAAKGK